MLISTTTGVLSTFPAKDGFNFHDTGVLVVGGTSGVGLATGIAFAAAGAARILIVGRDEQRGREAVERISETNPRATVAFIAADVNEPAAAAAATEQAVQVIGHIDVLVNSTAAAYHPELLHELPIEEVPNILTQLAVGPMLMSRAVLPIMRRQKSGSIVNIASDAAKVPTPGETCIGAAMAAIVTFSQTLAVEAKRDGVRVNVLTPSLIVNTGSYDRVMKQEFSKKIFDRITAQAHLGMTEPEDLANAILFLCSGMARRITGQVLSINGGISVA